MEHRTNGYIPAAARWAIPSIGTRKDGQPCDDYWTDGQLIGFEVRLLLSSLHSLYACPPIPS